MKKQIVGIGSALLDILVNVTDEDLMQLNGKKGGMVYVDSDFADAFLNQKNISPIKAPGGSVSNVISGIAMLGGKASFIGKIGQDVSGKYIQTEYDKGGVKSLLSVSTSSTGKVVSAITPDGERTMFTHLGAASEMDISDIESLKKNILDADYVVIEGYLLFNEELFLEILDIAKKGSSKIVMDLSSYTVVEEKKEFISKKVMPHVNILLANEDEAFSYTDKKDEAALRILSKYTDIAIINRGEMGSLISSKNKNPINIQARKIDNVIDTTGAGDSWLSGFLFGLSNKYDIETSGHFASLCASFVCQIMGAHLSLNDWQKVKENFNI